jgi:hypothetical protein
MKFGLEIFNYEPIVYTELALVEKEMAQLSDIWDLKDAWDKQIDGWKDVKFHDI